MGAGLTHGSSGLMNMGVCLGAAPGTFIHDPSAEEVLQPLIQAGGHPVLLPHPRRWHLLGGKSRRESYPGQEDPPIHSGPSPLDLDWPLLAPWKCRLQSTWKFPKLGGSHHSKDCYCLADRFTICDKV